MGEAEQAAVALVRTWAEAVLRQIERVRAVSGKHERLWRAFERMVGEIEQSDTDTLARVFRERWAEENTLVWSAYQLELWTARVGRERGEPAPEATERLKILRDALEHLNEAEFVADSHESFAVPGQEAIDTLAQGKPWKSWKWKALLDLPDKRLSVSLGDDNELFGLLDATTVEANALAAIGRIEQELDEVAREEWIALQDG